MIDEWQIAPNIWNAVRYEVDRRTKHAGIGEVPPKAVPYVTITSGTLHIFDITRKQYYEG